MAQYSLNAYDADVYIPEFRGLMQAGDQMGTDLRYAAECINLETVNGVLQPVPKIDGVVLKRNASTYLNVSEGTLMFLKDENPVSTKLVKIGGLEEVSPNTPPVTITPGGYWDTYLVVAGAKLYKIEMAGDPKEMDAYILTEITAPTGVTFENDCSWTTYEIQVNGPLGPASKVPANVLIFTCGKNICSYRNGTATKLTVPTGGYNYTCVARFAERIWTSQRDTIYYSRPFSCTDWTQDDDDPANGGGEIRLATFDDDPINAMCTLGDSLIVFSKKRAWKIQGSDPSNFIVQEQYGNGCLYPKTVAMMDKQIVMVGEEGLVVYDGYQVAPFLRDQTKELMRKIKFPFDKLKGARIGHKYILSFTGEIGTEMKRDYDVNETGWVDPDHDAHSSDPSTIVKENIDLREGYKMLIYDEEEGSVILRSAPMAVSFCNQQPFALVKDGSRNYLTRITFDSWYQHNITTKATKWVSPWITFGRQDIKKGGFELYFTPEVEPKWARSHQLWDSSNPFTGYPVFKTTETAGDVDLKISIQTEKKTKTKTYKIKHLEAEELAADKKHKMKRLHFGGAGRRFRVIIETESGHTIPWRLIGGIHIIAETDRD